MTRSHGNCGFVLVLVELITPLYPGPLVQVFYFKKDVITHLVREVSTAQVFVQCASQAPLASGSGSLMSFTPAKPLSRPNLTVADKGHLFFEACRL